MNFNPKVSIVIPVYNGSNYLREAIDSALAQTYKNIEIIVVNDGSNDSGATEEIALSYGEKIQYFSKPNGGVATALNMGIEKMTGEYFSWLSHDDKYLPEKLSTLINVLTGVEDKTTILYSDYELIDEKSSLITQITLNHEQLEEKPLYSLLRGSVHGCSMLIHKDCFEKVGGFNLGLKTTQDYDLWFRMLQKYSFKHINRYLIQSRWHTEQDSKKSPHTIKEANELWIHMMSSLTEKQRLSCENTSYLFYFQLSKFLKETPYQEAYDYCCRLVDDELIKIENSSSDVLVSVVIPFVDRVNWLIDAVISVQKQTYHNLEILIIDNGCEENIEPLLGLMKHDNRIQLLQETKRGTSFARNCGINKSLGKYLAFLDADDLWCENKIEEQLKFCLLNGADFCHTSYSTFDPNSVEKYINSASQSGHLFPALISGCGIATPTVMISRKIISDGFRFPSGLSIGEDVSLWIDVSEFYYIYSINQYLTKVRMHGNNAAYSKIKQYEGILNIALHVLKTKSFDRVESAFYTLIRNNILINSENNSVGNIIDSQILKDEILTLKNDILNVKNSRSYIISRQIASNGLLRIVYFKFARPIYRMIRKVKKYVS